MVFHDDFISSTVLSSVFRASAVERAKGHELSLSLPYTQTYIYIY